MVACRRSVADFLGSITLRGGATFDDRLPGPQHQTAVEWLPVYCKHQVTFDVNA